MGETAANNLGSHPGYYRLFTLIIWENYERSNECHFVFTVHICGDTAAAAAAALMWRLFCVVAS